MLDCEEKKSRGEVAARSTLITSFKPRQILLSSSNRNMKVEKEKEKSKKIFSLYPQQRVLLLQSICQFLENNGFLKTLKKFRHESDIEKEAWKSCLLNLEEMYHEYLQKSSNINAVDNASKEQDTKQANECDDEKKSETFRENGSLGGDNLKSKKKKKSKSVDDSSEQAVEGTQLKLSEQPGEGTLSVPSEPVKKSKDKKKKLKSESESLNEDQQEKLAEVSAGETSEKADCESQEAKKEKPKSKKKKEDSSISNNSSKENGEAMCTEKLATAENQQTPKDSKKRKKSSSDDNETGHVEEPAFDCSKRSKIDNLDKSNGTLQPTKAHKGSADGDLEKDGENKSEKKNKEQQNGSAAPTTAKAFRRVNPDEVKFVDERLQDNSYWAKDGADSGYGAKAQEVLGQVKGRGFRHEKTKKKRGSYRGGQIDLQSHSIKFNYDEDDE